jgi:excisionase family DNA binding protein
MEESLERINLRLEHIEQLTAIGAKPILDIEETAVYTGLSKAHLYRLTSDRMIPHYKKNKKLYFRKSELDDWMTESRVMTAYEIDSRATTYVAINK